MQQAIGLAHEDDLLTGDEVAKILKVHVASLAAWRSQRRGPKFLKLGELKKSPVRYRRGDIDDYLKKVGSK
jgi:hypothetical protein